MGHLAKNADGHLTKHPDTGHLSICATPPCNVCADCSATPITMTVADVDAAVCPGPYDIGSGLGTYAYSNLQVDGIHTLTNWDGCNGFINVVGTLDVAYVGTLGDDTETIDITAIVEGTSDPSPDFGLVVSVNFTGGITIGIGLLVSVFFKEQYECYCVETEPQVFLNGNICGDIDEAAGGGTVVLS